ncbi:MAG: hypothetical protein KDK53_12210 [Maritimibacter sp.]|nr:hypothetical protein [Maritimibacter sp.]
MTFVGAILRWAFARISLPGALSMVAYATARRPARTLAVGFCPDLPKQPVEFFLMFSGSYVKPSRNFEFSSQIRFRIFRNVFLFFLLAAAAALMMRTKSMKPDEHPRQTLVAANDNPGGSVSVTVVLRDIVALMAKAYVTELKSRKGGGS